MADLSPPTATAGLWPDAPQTEMVRHEIRRRALTVQTVERLTPQMIRITLTGEDLADFPSVGTDDHVKLVLPDGGEKPQMRDYTPRSFDTAKRQLVLDFAVHDAGPATAWALATKPGDAITIAGPRGSRVVPPQVTRWLLIGDETALPAIGRRIEESPAGAELTVLGVVQDAGEEQSFATPADLSLHWLHRPAAQVADPAPVVEAVRNIDIAPGTYVWIAAEAGVARALRNHFTEDRGVPATWIKAAGYWVQGEADASDKSL